MAKKPTQRPKRWRGLGVLHPALRFYSRRGDGAHPAGAVQMQIERDLAARTGCVFVAIWEIHGIAVHAFASTAEVIEYQCD
jgi:hypothetical protein